MRIRLLSSAHFILMFNFFFIVSNVKAQVSDEIEDFDPKPRGQNGLRVMFCNVENLFDTFNDPATNDDEFTFTGAKRWSQKRYKEKLNNIAKTVIAIGGWEPPDVVGLCEIENYQVLHDLTNNTPLSKFGYQIVHENSQDARGIDNALLYRAEKLEKIKHKAIEVHTKDETRTREILLVSFDFLEKDIIYFLVNHWPSRYRGEAFTASKRVEAACSLREIVDSLLFLNGHSKILIMGDYNDEPGDESIFNHLGAGLVELSPKTNDLYNLSFSSYTKGRGTITYKEIDHAWYLFDQMIVSGSLLNGTGLVTKGTKHHIFSTEWLLLDGRPFRTYQGPIYKGGFSDHLPIFIDLYYVE